MPVDADATTCPVCGYDELGEAPWAGGIPSHEICPRCGIQFGYDDARDDLREGIHHGWRGAWARFGRPWAHPREQPGSSS